MRQRGHHGALDLNTSRPSLEPSSRAARETPETATSLTDGGGLGVVLRASRLIVSWSWGKCTLSLKPINPAT